jgi:hypothetical protein
MHRVRLISSFELYEFFYEVIKCKIEFGQDLFTRILYKFI